MFAGVVEGFTVVKGFLAYGAKVLSLRTAKPKSLPNLQK